MLKPIKSTRRRAAGVRVVIVASRYNARYVDGMVRAARTTLAQSGAAVELVRVPGAFEIPVVAATLASGELPPAAIVCLGVILRGATHHAQTICDAITQALARTACDSGIPVVHEVLMVENEQQARERCLDSKHNRGAEAAQTALAMVAVMATVRAQEDARRRREWDAFDARSGKKSRPERNADDDVPF